MAVAELNGQASKDCPILGYAGFTWPNFIGADVGKIVEANIQSGPEMFAAVFSQQTARTTSEFCWDLASPRATLRSHIGDHLEASVKLGNYRLPGFYLTNSPVPTTAEHLRPSAPANLKHTVPREKFLCLKQEVHTHWENIQEPELAQKFKDLAKLHNDEFNPSGVPFKSRRPADEPLEALPEAAAEPLRPRDGQYPDLTAFKAG